MAPKQIVILRHAEKPDQRGDTALSTKGFTRAAALAVHLPAAFGVPDFIVATMESVDSNRPVLTVTPLAQRLGIALSAEHRDKEYADVATALLNHAKYDGKSVIVCWHHGKIPALTAALGVADPPAWDERVFDRVWLVTFPAGQATLADLPQTLLFGDAPA